MGKINAVIIIIILVSISCSSKKTAAREYNQVEVHSEDSSATSFKEVVLEDYSYELDIDSIVFSWMNWMPGGYSDSSTNKSNVKTVAYGLKLKKGSKSKSLQEQDCSFRDLNHWSYNDSSEKITERSKPGNARAWIVIFILAIVFTYRIYLRTRK